MGQWIYHRTDRQIAQRIENKRTPTNALINALPTMSTDALTNELSDATTNASIKALTMNEERHIV